MNIILSENDLLNAARQLKKIPDGLPKVLQKAINKVLPGVRTDIVKAGKKVYTLKPNVMRSHIYIRRVSARYGRLEGKVAGSSKTISLLKFEHKQSKLIKPENTPGAYRKTTVKIKKDQPEQLLQGGFFAIMKGNKGLWKRKSRIRKDVKKLYGPSMANLVRKPDVQGIVKPLAKERLSKELTRAIDWTLTKAGFK